MSMPHTCRCGICGSEMSPMFIGPAQTIGSKPVEFKQARAEMRTETYQIVPRIARQERCPHGVHPLNRCEKCD